MTPLIETITAAHDVAGFLRDDLTKAQDQATGERAERIARLRQRAQDLRNDLAMLLVEVEAEEG